MLKLDEVARLVPAADEVLMPVVASGVNRAEVRVCSRAISDRMPVLLPFTLS